MKKVLLLCLVGFLMIGNAVCREDGNEVSVASGQESLLKEYLNK